MYHNCAIIVNLTRTRTPRRFLKPRGMDESDDNWQNFLNIHHDLGVSNRGGKPPQIINSNRGFPYKPSILGAHPYFWKHPFPRFCMWKFLELNNPRTCKANLSTEVVCKCRGSLSTTGGLEWKWTNVGERGVEGKWLIRLRMKRIKKMKIILWHPAPCLNPANNPYPKPVQESIEGILAPNTSEKTPAGKTQLSRLHHGNFMLLKKIMVWKFTVGWIWRFYFGKGNAFPKMLSILGGIIFLHFRVVLEISRASLGKKPCLEFGAPLHHFWTPKRPPEKVPTTRLIWSWQWNMQEKCFRNLVSCNMSYLKKGGLGFHKNPV